MKLTNKAELFIKVFGKNFRVRLVTPSIDKANQFMSENPETAFISEGLYYIVNEEPINPKRQKEPKRKKDLSSLPASHFLTGLNVC